MNYGIVFDNDWNIFQVQSNNTTTPHRGVKAEVREKHRVHSYIGI